MWAVALICIAVVNCNAKKCLEQTTDVPEMASGEQRIVGGSDTTIEKYPYVVQVLLRKKMKISFQCGGSLVTKSHVLTAAHCFVNGNKSYERMPNRFGILEGTTYRLGKDGTEHRVTAIKVHEYYDTDIVNFDAALVLMTTPVNYSVSVARENIIPKMYPVVPDNAEVIAVGWGDTSLDSIIPPTDVLQEVKLQKIRLFICKDRYKNLRKEVGANYTITNNMICAGIEVGGKDACYGDSGGPLIYKNIIVGIISWAHSCAEPKIPGVYTDVTKINHWIQKTCNALSLQDHDDRMKVSPEEIGNGTNPDNLGSTGSLSSRIGFALLALILYYMPNVYML